VLNLSIISIKAVVIKFKGESIFSKPPNKWANRFCLMKKLALIAKTRCLGKTSLSKKRKGHLRKSSQVAKDKKKKAKNKKKYLKERTKVS